MYFDNTANLAMHLRVLAFVSAFILTVSTPVTVVAQEPIHAPATDNFGVERKTGRASFPLPELVTIGGEGEGRLSVGHTLIDGAFMTLAGLPSIKGQVVDPCAGQMSCPPYNTEDPASERFILFTISYRGINERFRQMWDGSEYSGPFLQEYPNGASFDGSTFLSRDGIRIERLSLDEYVVEHPEGLKLWFKSNEYTYTWGYVKNNLGFSIEFSGDQNLRTYKGINLSEDFCDILSAPSCSGLTAERSGHLEVATAQRLDSSGNPMELPETYTFTDSAGRESILRNVFFGVEVARPYCFQGGIGGGESGGWTTCTPGDFGWVAFPAGYTFPGDDAETYTITYNKAPDQFHQVTHQKIRIIQIEHQGQLVDYDVLVHVPSSQTPYVPSYLHLTSEIAGVEQSYSLSVDLPPLWGFSRSQLQRVRDANGNEQTFAHNQFSEISSVTYPEGNGSGLGRDQNYNLTSLTTRSKVSGEEALTTSFEYLSSCSGVSKASCTKPIAKTDPLGNRWEYTYNDRGQLLTETGPAPSPGASRPIIRNEYTERTAYILDGNGGLVAAGPPISLLTRTSQCISTENCEGTADEIVTEYDYGPLPAPGQEYATNLLLRGISVTAADASGQIQTLRTCYSYNYFGEKISETAPRADLAACP